MYDWTANVEALRIRSMNLNMCMFEDTFSRGAGQIMKSASVSKTIIQSTFLINENS